MVTNAFFFFFIFVRINGFNCIRLHPILSLNLNKIYSFLKPRKELFKFALSLSLSLTLQSANPFSPKIPTNQT